MPTIAPVLSALLLLSLPPLPPPLLPLHTGLPDSGVYSTMFWFRFLRAGSRPVVTVPFPPFNSTAPVFVAR